MHHYGIDINNLQSLFDKPAASLTTFGSHSTLATSPDYRLEQLIVEPGKTATLVVPKDEEATVFSETGETSINSALLSAHGLVTLPSSSQSELAAITPSTLYVFYGPSGESTAEGTAAQPSVSSPEDYRDKYWGNIQTMVNASYTGKRLFFQKGQNSSLHFHCNKSETYFIHSGELFVRLRAGRGEDRFFTLKSGDTLFIPPGLMHQDGAIEDTVIIEVSTHDEDSDSFIVEDGAKSKMPGLLA